MTWGIGKTLRPQRNKFGPNGMYGTKRYPQPFMRLNCIHEYSRLNAMIKITEWYLEYLVNHMMALRKPQKGQPTDRKMAKYKHAFKLHTERLKRFKDEYDRKLSEPRTSRRSPRRR